MNWQLQIRGAGVALTQRLKTGDITIGRKRTPADPPNAVTADLTIDTPQLALVHIRLECSESECWLTDLGSEYGTRLNDKRLTPWSRVQLAVTDKLVIGLDYTITFGTGPVLGQPGTPLHPATRQLPTPLPQRVTPYEGVPPPGLTRYSVRLLQNLPELYQLNGHTSEPQAAIATVDYDSAESFLSRFLALFESILLPTEWTIVNFDLFLQLQSAPPDFYFWFANWFGLLLDSTWSDQQRRTLLVEANALFAQRGTRYALSRILEIYSGKAPDIIENLDGPTPHIFAVKVYPTEQTFDMAVAKALVDLFKPAHTVCRWL